MGRYTGPKRRLCRREGVNLFGPKKYDLEKYGNIPGQHGGKGRRTKLSNYGIQLREKQKMKRIYGVLEKQFRLMFQRAAAQKGVTGENLISLLESRIDNILYRAVMTRTRMEARQFVCHGHVLVNGIRVDIPSYRTSVGDLIEIKNTEKTKERIKKAWDEQKDRIVPSWLTVDQAAYKVTVDRQPTKQDAALPVEESMIVELYSK